MNKFFTLAGIIAGVILCYMFILPAWPIVTGSAFDAANSVNATAYAYEYRATTAGLRFAPLLLFMAPAVIGIVMAFIVLKRPGQQEQR